MEDNKHKSNTNLAVEYCLIWASMESNDEEKIPYKTVTLDEIASEPSRWD